MSKIYVRKAFTSMEPMEAIVEMYKMGESLQKIVNTFLDSRVTEYNVDRIRKLLRRYKELVASGEFEHYSDIELEETEELYSDAVAEECQVYNRSNFRHEYVVEAIINWYEKGISISSMLESIRDAKIKSYSATRIQNIIKIYKRLKKNGEYENPTDVELEEGMPLKAVAKQKNVSRASKRSSKVTKKNVVEIEEIEELDDTEEVEDFSCDDILDSDLEFLCNDDVSCDDIDDESTSLSDSRFHTDEEIEKIVDDPLPIFRELNNHVMMVGQRLTAALLVTGPGGIGKSYSVQRVLSEFGDEKKDFVIMKGKCTASAMYDFLFRNHDKICVFDDCDSVLCDKEGIAVLKGALDSGKDREISWNTRGVDMVDTFDCDNRKQVIEKLTKWSKRHGDRKGIPTHFQFEGSVIFISNMSRQEIKAKDAALLTRCSVVDISINNEEFLERLNALLPVFKIYDARGKNIAEKKMKKEVYDWISSDDFLNHPKMQGNSLDFRTFIKAYKARYAKIPMWKEISFAS